MAGLGNVKFPDGKILIPGLVTHSTNVVEHPELIAWRIKNFARLLGRENVIAGTDCGFSQNWNTVRVHPSIQWAKLEALAQGAARIEGAVEEIICRVGEIAAIRPTTNSESAAILPTL